MRNRLLLPDDAHKKSILLAVSGGIDSMSLAHIFVKNNLCKRVAIATVNFSLRGEESDGDFAFVKEWASERGVECFSTIFDTKSYAAEHSISTQMAARELRYGWFEQIARENGFDHIAIAHNLNDSVETLFINLLRGAGLRGITGISYSNGLIIRPLLNITREEIVRYVEKNAIPYREDATNSESHYVRNRIRNEIFPQFKEINPSFLETISRDISHFSQAEAILSKVFKEKEGTLYWQEDGVGYISIEKLREESEREYWLHRILEQYGFNSTLIPKISDLIEAQPGKRFSSDTHTVIRDRDYFKIYLNGLFSENCGGKLSVDIVNRNEIVSLVPPEGKLYVDADKVQFPLEARVWQLSDRFTPLGMRGSKKVSDFFVDMKLDLLQKGRVRVVTTKKNGTTQIVCVAPLRIDDSFKIDSQTTRVAIISLE